LRALLPEVARWGDTLAEGPLPLTLDHNDLHANNAFVPQPGERHLRFFDLADAVVGHPFGSLLVPLNVLAHRLDAGPDDPRVRRVVDAYLDAWTELADAGALRALLPAALRLARLNRHESWRRVLPTISEAERAEYGHLAPRWLTRLLEPPVLEGAD
jgi:Ser/Thr protein kinase RdoA (MazF antagonist)